MDTFMQEALRLAKKAYKKGEVPVGAVVVYNNRIIGRGYNKRETKKDVTMHAEIIAIKQASKKLRTRYLNNCVLYVTLEPCMMCMGAISQSFIKKIFFSTYSDKYGYFKKSNIKNITYEVGLEMEQSKILLKNFFKDRRD